eukprot:03277_4
MSSARRDAALHQVLLLPPHFPTSLLLFFSHIQRQLLASSRLLPHSSPLALAFSAFLNALLLKRPQCGPQRPDRARGGGQGSPQTYPSTRARWPRETSQSCRGTHSGSSP